MNIPKSLTYLVVKYNGIIEFRKQAEKKALERENEPAARMWRHKREGLEQAVRDINSIIKAFDRDAKREKQKDEKVIEQAADYIKNS